MKKRIISLLLLVTTVCFYAQAGIGVSNPDQSAMLEVNASNKGVLFPRVALNSFNDGTTIVNPAKSLLVYNTGSTGLSEGFYYNAGTPASPVWASLQGITDTTGTETAKVIYTGASADPNKIVTIGDLVLRFSSGGINTTIPQIALRTSKSKQLNIGVNQQYATNGFEYDNNSINFTTSNFSTFQNIPPRGPQMANNELNICHIVDANDNKYYRVTFYLSNNNSYMIIAERF